MVIGKAFEIKVADADLNVRTADIGLPITITATSGDKEAVVLKPAFSHGVYLGSIETALGEIKPGDGILQVRGNDKVKITYLDRFSSDGANIERTVTMDLATDASLMTLAQSGLPIYQEVQDYQKKNILDDSWEIVGTLPKTASKFFRDSRDGTLYRKGVRLGNAFLFSIKAGQAFYVELNEPDEDTTDAPDVIQVDISTQNGKKLQAPLTENRPAYRHFLPVW